MLEADRDLNHLYKDFRVKLEAALKQANLECKKYTGFSHWMVVEGYRSIPRQQHLYKLGRSLPGNKVTNTPIPGVHGFGLAVDVTWVNTSGEVVWENNMNILNTLGHCVRANGLFWGGDWSGTLGDYGHIQYSKEIDINLKKLAKVYISSLGLTSPSL